VNPSRRRRSTLLSRHPNLRASAFLALALLLAAAQFLASAHRIVHADHEADLPPGHSCLVFDAVLGGTAPPPSIVVIPVAVELPAASCAATAIAVPASARRWAAFRPRDPPAVRVT
jgi:hypothetical protein